MIKQQRKLIILFKKHYNLSLESIKEVVTLLNPTVKKFLEHDALNYYAGLEKLNW